MKLFLPILFIFIQLFNGSSAAAQSESKIDTDLAVESLYQSKELITFLSAPLKDSLSLVKKDAKFGLVDSENNLIVPMIYDKIEISSTNNFSIRQMYLTVLEYNEYYEGTGLYRQTGNETEEEYKTLLQQELDNPKSFFYHYDNFLSNPIFTAKKNDNWGAINKSNEVIIPFVYESLSEVGYDIFLAKKEGRYGILDTENRVLVPFDCDTIIVMVMSMPISSPESRNGYACGLLKADGKYGLINLLTKQVMLPNYDDLEQCYCHIEFDCVCAFSSNWIHSDFTSNFFINPKKHSFNRLLIFKKNNKYGLLNVATMQEVTSTLYDSIRFKPNERRFSIVYLNDKATFLTHNNSRLHAKLYDEVSTLDPYYSLPFYFFKVKDMGKSGAFDQNGKNILPLKWDDVLHVEQVSDSTKYRFIVEKDGKYGVVNNDSQILVPLRYDSIFFEYDRVEPDYTIYRNGKSKKVEFD